MTTERGFCIWEEDESGEVTGQRLNVRDDDKGKTLLFHLTSPDMAITMRDARELASWLIGHAIDVDPPEVTVADEVRSRLANVASATYVAGGGGGGTTQSSLWRADPAISVYNTDLGGTTTCQTPGCAMFGKVIDYGVHQHYHPAGS